jgi:hypothetical protein
MVAQAAYNHLATDAGDQNRSLNKKQHESKKGLWVLLYDGFLPAVLGQSRCEENQAIGKEEVME